MANNRKLMTAEEQQERLSKAFDTVCSFPEGIEVLRHIYELTGYGAELVRFDDLGDVMHNATLYNLAKRDLWLNVQRHLDSKQISEIEVGG